MNILMEIFFVVLKEIDTIVNSGVYRLELSNNNYYWLGSAIENNEQSYLYR